MVALKLRLYRKSRQKWLSWPLLSEYLFVAPWSDQRNLLWLFFSNELIIFIHLMCLIHCSHYFFLMLTLTIADQCLFGLSFWHDFVRFLLLPCFRHNKILQIHSGHFLPRSATSHFSKKISFSREMVLRRCNLRVRGICCYWVAINPSFFGGQS